MGHGQNGKWAEQEGIASQVILRISPQFSLVQGHPHGDHVEHGKQWAFHIRIAPMPKAEVEQRDTVLLPNCGASLKADRMNGFVSCWQESDGEPEASCCNLFSVFNSPNHHRCWRPPDPVAARFTHDGVVFKTCGAIDDCKTSLFTTHTPLVAPAGRVQLRIAVRADPSQVLNVVK